MFCDVQDTYIEEDKDLVASYFELGEDEKLKRMSPWLLRIELNREMMVDKKLTMSDIADRIDREFNDELHCIFSDDNAEKLILRVRPPIFSPRTNFESNTVEREAPCENSAEIELVAFEELICCDWFGGPCPIEPSCSIV